MAICIVGIIAFFVPGGITFGMAKDVFEVSITVLAIIFSIFFAALTVLITAGDNQFVQFLEEDGSYRSIVWTFKITLLLLFVALMFSIGLFVTVLNFEGQSGLYPEWLVLLFAFVALFALFATVSASMDAIKYAEFRAMYLKIIGTEQDSE